MHKYIFLTLNKKKAYNLIYSEFVYRFFYCCFCICISSITVYAYSTEILYIFVKPLLLYEKNFIFTSITEAFSTIITFCIVVGFFSSIPYLYYQSCCFLLSGCFYHEKQKLLFMCFLSFFLFIFSVYTCNIYILPELCRFCLKFEVYEKPLLLILQARISTYVFWSVNVYCFCILFFEIPVLFWLSTYYFPSFPLFLSKNRTIIFILLLMLCALCSPPDVSSETFLFILCIFLFELGLWLGFLQQKIYINKTKDKNVSFL